MSWTNFDVLVIGGGPIGSYTAYQLGAEGFEVALVEKKGRVGSGVVCSGIIGVEAFRRYDLPREAIVHQMDRVRVYSPRLSTLEFVLEAPLAYVVDRELYDRKLYEQARGQGVACFTGHRVETIRVGKQGVEVCAIDGGGLPVALRARCCVLATGTHYRLHRQVGLDTPGRFLLGAQVSGAVTGLEGTEVYVGSEVAPGSFAWAVPAGKVAKVGVMVYERPRAYLRRFLETRLRGRGDGDGQPFGLRPISNALVARTSGERVLAVGEAAGQVKTTTGGGLYFGLVGSELAVQVLKKAFRRGNLSGTSLAEYDRLWHAQLARELELGLAFRRAISRLDDGRIEFLLRLLARRLGIKEYLLRRFQFDRHGDVIRVVLKYLGKFALLSRVAGYFL